MGDEEIPEGAEFRWSVAVYEIPGGEMFARITTPLSEHTDQLGDETRAMFAMLGQVISGGPPGPE